MKAWNNGELSLDHRVNKVQLVAGLILPVVYGLGMEGCSKFEWKGKESGFCCKDEMLELSRPDL